MSQKAKTVTRIKSDYMQQYDVHMERQKRKKKRLIRRLLLFAFVVVIVYSGVIMYYVNQRAVYAEKKAQYEVLNEELRTLEKEENHLLEEIDLLNDVDYILDLARSDYFLSKKGETIFKTPDEERTY